ncbi:hypothetical protein Sdia_59340 [Streptomyces diastaticus subsp. diastaticus]|uniref:Uncharacterized protein n=1 Tax=Streptomyces diastaticus subsp. diastaticus TaxID=68040 RepID=A0ABQ1CY66_STRDI|nr:hypothetical protein Sdia_59340 [Streptomyces diastaticus subsp. diastaticus]
MPGRVRIGVRSGPMVPKPCGLPGCMARVRKSTWAPWKARLFLLAVLSLARLGPRLLGLGFPRRRR